MQNALSRQSGQESWITMSIENFANPIDTKNVFECFLFIAKNLFVGIEGWNLCSKVIEQGNSFQFQKHLMVQSHEGLFSLSNQLFCPEYM